MKSVKYRKRIRTRALIIVLSVAFVFFATFAGLVLTSPDFWVAVKVKAAEKYVSKARYDDAIEACNEALNIDGTSPKVYDGLRRAYIAKGDRVYDGDYNLAMDCYGNALLASQRGLSATGDNSFSVRISELEKLMTDRHKHDSGSFFTVKEPTCTEDGIRERRCNTCGEVVNSFTLPKLPHTSGDWEVASQATCTAHGLKVKKCTVCGTVLESEYLPKLGHEPGDWEVARESDCAPGLNVRKCLRCGDIVEEEEVPAKMAHKKGSWEIVTEPDCENPGKKVLKCTKCENIIETEEIPANGHNKESKGEKFRDTDVLIYKCTVCGKVIEPKSIARVLYMESLPQVVKDDLFPETSAEYDTNGKLQISFKLNEALEISDYGFTLYNADELPDGIVVSYDESRSKVRAVTVLPRSLDKATDSCSITDTSDEIGTILKPATAYYYRVFFIFEDYIYISDFHRFTTKME